MTNAARSARFRSKGKTITVLLDPETYELLQTLQRQLDMTQAEAVRAAIRALCPKQATREVSQAEVDAIFDDIEAAAARARQLRGQS